VRKLYRNQTEIIYKNIQNQANVEGWKWKIEGVMRKRKKGHLLHCLYEQWRRWVGTPTLLDVLGNILKGYHEVLLAAERKLKIYHPHFFYKKINIYLSTK